MEPLVERARAYATQAHARIDQRRKYSGQPYDVHLRSVAALVASVSDDPQMLAAAWLHDTVEDTPATREDIEREFGPAVAELVIELTDVSSPKDGNRAARKAIDRLHLAQASPRAKTVKLADLIDNCRDICRHDERFARTFVAEAAALIEVLGEGDARLLGQARKTVSRCADEIGLSLDLLPAAGPDTERRPVPRVLAIERLMTAFSAQDVVRPLASFDDTRWATEVAGLMRERELDVAGIRCDGLVTGYVLPADLAEGRCGDAMRAFGARQVLDGNAGLSDVVEGLTRYDHAFVGVLGQVVGVATRADLQGPIGRMWLFGMVTLIELYVAQRIRARWPRGDWEALLTPRRLQVAQALRDERSRRGQQCELLDCLQLADKTDILLCDAEELRRLDFPTRGAGQRVARDLQSLRNNLAHAQDIVEHDWPQIVRLARRFEGILAEGSGRAGFPESQLP
jgi:hypothetical protein